MAMLDFVTLIAIYYVTILALEIQFINPKKTEETNPKPKAEYHIVVTWPHNFNDDVDTWVEDPAGHLVSFNRREDGLMHLDRDDRGDLNDEVTTKFGKFTYKSNREMVTVRGKMAGEFIANVHLWHKRNENGTKGKPTPVTIRIDQLNPFQTLKTVVVHLEEKGSEVTAFRFTTDADGKVTSMNRLPKALVNGSKPTEFEPATGVPPNLDEDG